MSSWIDRHSVGCLICGDMHDERECYQGGLEIGHLCGDCVCLVEEWISLCIRYAAEHSRYFTMDELTIHSGAVVVSLQEFLDCIAEVMIGCTEHEVNIAYVNLRRLV